MEASYTESSEFIDFWRTDNDRYPRAWEDRFIYSSGYVLHTQKAISALLEKHNLTLGDFDKVVFNAPDIRRHRELARGLGLDKSQTQDTLFTMIGNTGAAFGPMMLVAALEEAKPGERILFANYGDGCDAYVFKVTDEIEKKKNKRGISRHLQSKTMLSNYEKYLRFRNLLEWEKELYFPERSALTTLWRERQQLYSLYGSKCRACGKIQFPIQRICAWCQAKDNYEKISLRDKKGKLFTFGMNERAPGVLDPPWILVIVDLDGGGRMYGAMTDGDPEKVEIGMPLELTFRRIHEGSGLPNYFWKFRPVRC